MSVRALSVLLLCLPIVHSGIDNVPPRDARYLLDLGQRFARLFPSSINTPQFAVLTMNKAGLSANFDPCHLSFANFPLTAQQNYVARIRVTASQPCGPRHSERQVLDHFPNLMTRNTPVRSTHIYSVNSPCRGCALEIARVARANPTVQFYVGYTRMFTPHGNPASVGQEILQFTRQQFRNVTNIHFAQLDPSCLQSSRSQSSAWTLFSGVFLTRGSCRLTSTPRTGGITCVVNSVLPTVSPVPDGYESLPGDCPGNDIWSLYRRSTSLETCARLCSGSSSCKAFMFHDNRECYPKSQSCQRPSTTNTKNVFYRKISPVAVPDGYESLPGDCPGNDIWSLYRRSTSLENCARLCSGSSSCKAFMFHDNRECYPKSQSCQCPATTNPKSVFYRKSLCNLQPVNGYRATCGDCGGNDLWNIYGDSVSLEECARRCSNDPRCNAFMFYNGHRCYPKTTACRQPTMTNSLNVFYTPETTCDNVPTKSYTARCGDCGGKNIWNIYANSVSVEECAGRCNSDPQCKAFMFYNGHRCYPKTETCAIASTTNPKNVFYDKCFPY